MKDIARLHPEHKDIPFLKNYEKFVDIVKWVSSEGEIDFQVKGCNFTASYFDCEKYEDSEGTKAIFRMKKQLKMFIEDKVNKELLDIKFALIKKYEKEYNINLFDRET